MPIGKLVFAQLMDFLPLHTFRRCVARYPSNYPTKTFSHLDQYLSMAFAQLTFRESLRDIEVCWTNGFAEGGLGGRGVEQVGYLLVWVGQDGPDRRSTQGRLLCQHCACG